MPEVPNIEALRRKIAEHKASLEALYLQLAVAEAQESQEDATVLKSQDVVVAESQAIEQLAVTETQTVKQDAAAWKWPLEAHEYERYSRQMIVPNFGLQGQALQSCCIRSTKTLLTPWFRSATIEKG